MIKEIKFPHPTIHETLSEVVKFFKKKRSYRYKQKTYDYIDFNRDYSFVEEFAEFCGIEHELAEQILRIFFDEIKQNLLQGNIVLIQNLGKFFLNKRCAFSFKVNKKIKFIMNEKYGCL